MMNKSINVYYNDVLIGILIENKDKKIVFQYDNNWLKNGFSINPFSLPLNDSIFVPKKPYFDGLFGVFADSLPDAWGRLLMDRYLKKNNINNISVIDKLAMISSFGMGALEYKPKYILDIYPAKLTFDEIALGCKKILLNEQNDNFDEIFKLGGSSGGARPKILTKIDDEDWIVKFNNHIDMKEIGLMEYEYSIVAKECGIDMPETRLFKSNNCAGYFGVKRFDRKNGKRIHMISAAALLEIDFRSPVLDYNDLMKLTKIVTNNNSYDLLQMFKRMCFNVFSKNQDDHAKNFSFIYNEENKCYRLAPAYDLTRSNTYYNEHTTSVDGNGNNPGEKELISVGIKSGISKEKCLLIIDDIKCKVNLKLNKYL